MTVVLVGVFEPKNEHENSMMLERKGLVDRLQNEGLNCVEVKSQWPRDDFTFHRDKIYFRKNEEHYADGGYVRAYPEFTIACEAVGENDETGRKDSIEKRTAKLKKLYGNHIQIVPNPNYALNQELRPHSDMVLFPIPEKKALFVDETYFGAHRKLVEEFGERYGLRVIRVSQDYHNPSWPCNTISVKHNDSMVNVTNAGVSSEFIAKLESLGNKVIAVPFMNNAVSGGSINCATNLIPKNRLGDLREIYEF